MIRALISAVLVLLVAAASTATAATQTNVLQNISITLTVYQQGATNSAGTRVANKVSSLTTKDLITALGTVTGQQFGTTAKLVLCTVYSNTIIDTGPGVFSTNLSTNLALTTNGLSVGGVDFYVDNDDEGILTISNNSFITGGVGNFATNIVSVVGSNVSVTINTNSGFITTITPSTNSSGRVTNAAILTVTQITPPPTESVLSIVSNSVEILYGGPGNALYPVDNYLSFSTNSPEIVVETGAGLNTTNALTVSNLISQTGVNIQGLQINYSMPTGANNLTLTLAGFVKQALKVDVLSARAPNRAVADIFGASSTWNAIGSGYMGGTFTTNLTPVQVLGGYLTNASPIVVEGSVNLSFLKNLAE